MPRTSMSIVAVAIALALVSARDRSDLLAQAQRSSFRTAVDLVSLQVTATDAAGRYVSNLTRDDFIVLEDGVQQEVTFFSPTGAPLALALLLDTSASMELKLPTAQEAAIGFVRQLGPEDLATAVDFDSRVQVLHDFTNDGAALERAIRRTTAGGSTSLYTAVYIAVQELRRLRPEQLPLGTRRRAIVVLSDGEDTSSLVAFDDVLDLAVRSDTTIYTIAIGGGEPGPQRSREAQFVLRRLAQQTGGRAFFPTDIKDLASVYGDIREELSRQYSLAYESRNPRHDGRWRTLTVRVAGSGFAVRARPGYYAASK